MLAVGRTECVTDAPSPVFESKVELDYFFETKQHVRFVVVQGARAREIKPKKLPFLYSLYQARCFVFDFAVDAVADMECGLPGSDAKLPELGRSVNRISKQEEDGCVLCSCSCS